MEHPSWLDPALYPFPGQRFDTPEGALHYVDVGRGRPLFLVHGTPSWSFEWRHVIAALSDRHRVIAPDHLGFGLSDKPADGAYRPEDHARRLLALFDRLDLHDVTLAVHDFGGPIGLPIALQRSERVARLVVLNSWMWPLGEQPRVRRLSALVASPLGRFLYLGCNASPRWLLPASFADRRRLSREVHRHYLAPFAARRERMAPYALARALTGSDAFYASLWAQRERMYGMPSTLLWGLKDPAFGTAELERFAGVLHDARVVTCEDAGHFLQEEAPDAVIDALAR